MVGEPVNHVIESEEEYVYKEAGFLPEIWNDEILTAYQKNLLLRDFYTDEAGHALADAIDRSVFDIAVYGTGAVAVQDSGEGPEYRAIPPGEIRQSFRTAPVDEESDHSS